MTNHTPGPWEPGIHGNAVYAGDTTIAVCDGASQSWPNFATVQANAHLIAAAPDMFSALLEAEVLLQQYPTIERMVKDALRKAEGRS